jgi:GGDEF domain-containing protein
MAPPQAKTPLPEPFPLDWTIAQDVEQSLCDPQSGLASINTFVFFLYREVKRFEKDHSPAVVVSFELRLQYNDGRFVPLPAEALPILSKQLRSVLSPIDVMTHVSNGEFAVVLPGSDRTTAEQFCHRLFAAMTETPLLANVKQIVCNIGAAAIPETSTDPEIVIAAARQASEMARQNNAPYFFFT